MSLLRRSIEAELAIRARLVETILEIVFSKYEIASYGHSKRGECYQLVWEQLGFAGRHSNELCNFVSKILLEELGVRKGWSRGAAVFYGLIAKA